MSRPQKVVVDMCEKFNLQTYFKTLFDVWSEMGLSGDAVKKKTQGIIEEVTSHAQGTLSEFVLAEEQTLRQFRVQAVRKEIAEWWLKCHYSEVQRQEFQEYYSEDYSDLLLLEHQQELNKLQIYHADNEQIFVAVEDYMKMHEKLMYLEAQDKNPNRLFENRGGQLLKDERDRKAVRRELPRLQKKVETLTADFEKKYKRQFTINGVCFAEMLKRRTDELKENVEELKEQNTEELKLRIGVCSGMKRKAPDAIANGAKSEGKIPANRIASGVKRFKVLNMQ